MEGKNIRLEPVRTTISKIIIFGVLVSIFLVSIYALNLNIAQFIGRLSNAPTVLSRFITVNISVLPYGITELLISIMLAICGLVIGGVISFVLAFCAANNTAFFKPLSVLIKGFASLLRAIPNLVLILMIIASIGMGYTAGVIALTLSSIGYLTKAFISTLEEQSSSVEEALRSGGANWIQVMFHGYLPSVITGFIAWISIRLESSVSESISLGILGIGGIGMLVNRAIRHNDMETLSTLILLIFISLYIIEMAVTRLRKVIR